MTGGRLGQIGALAILACCSCAFTTHAHDQLVTTAARCNLCNPIDCDQCNVPVKDNQLESKVEQTQSICNSLTDLQYYLPNFPYYHMFSFSYLIPPHQASTQTNAKHTNTAGRPATVASPAEGCSARRLPDADATGCYAAPDGSQSP